MNTARRDETTEGLQAPAINNGEGVRELMRAVLLDAIMCLRRRVGPPLERERLAGEAQRWMMSAVRTWPFSFESICDVLGISAAYLRRVLLRPPGSGAVGSHPDAERAEHMVRRLSLWRMRGNQITRIRPTRRARAARG